MVMMTMMMMMSMMMAGVHLMTCLPLILLLLPFCCSWVWTQGLGLFGFGTHGLSAMRRRRSTSGKAGFGSWIAGLRVFSLAIGAQSLQRVFEGVGLSE